MASSMRARKTAPAMPRWKSRMNRCTKSRAICCARKSPTSRSRRPTTTPWSPSPRRIRQLLRRKEQELTERLGAVDKLTGLWNRQAVHLRLAEEIERVQRTRQPCAICFVDLDDFAKINELHGQLHWRRRAESGGRLLRQPFARLRHHLPARRRGIPALPAQYRPRPGRRADQPPARKTRRLTASKSTATRFRSPPRSASSTWNPSSSSRKPWSASNAPNSSPNRKAATGSASGMTVSTPSSRKSKSSCQIFRHP